MATIIITGFEVLVDDEDAHLLAHGTWRFHESKKGGKRYLQWSTSRNGKRERIVFHRFVMGAQRGQIVDHINGDSRDNRKVNLRFADHFINAKNALKYSTPKSSRFKGVSLKRGVWHSNIMSNGKAKYLGSYHNEVQAAYAYDLGSLALHGEYGRTNFLPLVK